MRSFSYALVLTLAACSSSSTPNKSNPDAAITTQHDAPPVVVVDAPPAALAGLGQKCNSTTPCPSSAMSCLSAQGATNGFCSLVCHAGATFMTDATGNPTDPNLGTVAADTTKCNAAYTGGAAGVADCDVPVNFNPVPTNPPQKSTTFTYDAYCGIDCGTGNTCPTGLTCDTTDMSCNP
jgi:hypothetical protein